MTPTQLYIDGQWSDATDKRTFAVLNPFDETELAQVASATTEDMARALDCADRAQKQWAATTPRHKAEVLRKAFEIFQRRLPEFIEIITLENGKAKSDATGEANYAAEFFRWYAEEAVRAEGHYGMAPASGARTLVHERPAGLALLITPWNYPAAMGTRKIAPALAAGCGVILKPASETPLTSLLLMEVLEEAGVPAGLVNVLPTRNTGPVIDQALNDPRVRVVSFTGSTEVGRTLLAGCARNVLNPAMELGGNAPFIVCEDADIDAAVEGLMVAKMRNIGEACTAANRIYVHDAVHDQFVEKFSAKMAALSLGNGLEDGIDVGPLVNASTRNKVHQFVEQAVEVGAKLVVGGTLPDGPGFLYPPTVLVDVPDNAACAQDEIFGPVAAIQRFSDEAEVIAKANNTEYGLVAYVYAGELGRGLKISEQLQFGMIGLNRGLVSDPAAPFGGVKQSGIGREGGREGIREFIETQYISTVI